MKKFIFACAIFLVPAVSVPGQTAAPPDTAALAPQPPDTAAAPPQQREIPADTGTVVTPKESAPADTGVVLPQPADTAAVSQPPQAAPADTGTAPPVESAPADTGTVVAPPKESAPVDTGTVTAPPPEGAPAVTGETGEGEGSLEPKVMKENRLGVGIAFNDEAPLSIRTWFNPKIGLDVGLGLRGRRVDDTTTISDSTPAPTDRVTMLELSFDLGIPIRVLRKDKVHFILRPGFGFRTRPSFEVNPEDPTVRSIETAVELEINGTVGFEYYPFEKVGFSLQAGLALVTERTGGDISNTIVRLQSLPSKKGVNFAFRYYVF